MGLGGRGWGVELWGVGGLGVGAAGEGWFRADVWRVISRCLIGFAEDRCVCGGFV